MVVAILATSLLGLINPLLLGVLFDQVLVGQDYTHLNLYVGLMIVIPIVTGLIGVGQATSTTSSARTSCRTCATPCTPISSGCPCASSPTPGPARSRAGWPTTSAGSRPW